MRGAPQSGFAVAMRMTNALISVSTVGRPPVEQPESLAQYSRNRRLPSQDGVGRHDHEGLPPPGPDSGKPDPEEAVTVA